MLQWFCLGWILGVSYMGKMWLNAHIGFWTAVCVMAAWLIMQRVMHPLIKDQSPFFKILNIGMSVMLGAYLGFGYASSRLDQRLMHVEHESGSMELIVYVARLNELGEQSVQQKIMVLNNANGALALDALPQYLAYIPYANLRSQQQELQLGKYYRLNGELRPAQSYATAGAFDQEKWFLQQNIASGFRVKQIQPLQEQQVSALGYTGFVKQQQRWLRQFPLWVEKQRLNLRVFIQHQPLQHKGLLLALLTGDESLLTKATKMQFQRFGMSHLLAISGPHVVIFAIMVSWLLQAAVARYRPQLYLTVPKQYVLIIPFLICVFMYCLFAGFEIPAVRTLLMCCLGSLMLLLQQKLQPLKLLIFSASVLLLIDPFSILSAAFWLSYGACFILLRIYQTLQQQQAKLEQELDWKTKVLLSLRLLAVSQWKIFIALLPLMILFFKQVSWITPFSNIAAIPWIGLIIVPLDIFAALAYGFSESLASLLFMLNDRCLAILLMFLEGLDALFSPKLTSIALTSKMVLLLALSLIILFLPRGVLPKSWAVIGLLALILKGYMPHAFELNILDVGQGQAIFIRDQHHSMMVDMGGNYDEDKFSVGRQIILPFLAVNAVSELDQLLLTHLDQDHSGGYFSIQQDFPIAQLIASERPSMPVQTQFHYCYQGQRWQWTDQLSIDVLSPSQQQVGTAARSKNENSCVLYIQLKNAAPYRSFLLMGDAGWETEYELMQKYPDLKADVIVLGHHGSRNSSSYDFLKALQPKLAIASAGKYNRYGHPSAVTQARLKQLNIPLLTTSQQGTIQFIQLDGKIQLHAAREEWKWLRRN
ncbi:DNA internalization-related competence protein ComEC/Rec2 [Acinetobacter pragensis]|uniref:Competence protein n=1 Tax=Acinetobacter pragensis TaxID=1806892 RepID=A0A151Y1M5_9GAMM|nr:DNA internalization-related competence protein ComEC/Rec2 [Acinetobacter pragensis]KYQ71904.1 competence protein [Acinetobacter pragensis]